MDAMVLTVEFFFFFQAEDGIRDVAVTGVQTCALPISPALLKPLDSSGFPVESSGFRSAGAAKIGASVRTASAMASEGRASIGWIFPQIGRASCRERV